MLRQALYLTCIFLLCSCTSLKTSELASSESANSLIQKQILKVGEKARFKLKDGSRMEFIVEKITDVSIEGAEHKILIEDIKSVETVEINESKTGFFAGGMFLVYIAIMLAADGFSL